MAGTVRGRVYVRSSDYVPTFSLRTVSSMVTAVQVFYPAVNSSLHRCSRVQLALRIGLAPSGAGRR